MPTPIPPTPRWLTDDDVFFRATDYLVVEVLFADLDVVTKLECCRQFYRAHGERTLLAALRDAAARQTLEPELVDLIDRLNTRGVAA